MPASYLANTSFALGFAAERHSVAAFHTAKRDACIRNLLAALPLDDMLFADDQSNATRRMFP
jgi:hypothetical protein